MQSSNHPARFALPEGGAARLFSFDHLAGFPWCIIAAASAAAVRSCLGCSRTSAVTAFAAWLFCAAICLSRAAFLTHDEGVSWPDATGEALAAATLEAGGAVALAFVTMGDALACKRRLEGGAA